MLHFFCKWPDLWGIQKYRWYKCIEYSETYWQLDFLRAWCFLFLLNAARLIGFFFWCLLIIQVERFYLYCACANVAFRMNTAAQAVKAIMSSMQNFGIGKMFTSFNEFKKYCLMIIAQPIRLFFVLKCAIKLLKEAPLCYYSHDLSTIQFY